ncbi:hypothetical protein C8Q70DRAFT_195486 [Cubamyces menziesii]|uniref:Uncharacterized protein n=1 Tax=Trametes cubensis TaxID=1111947 RepID=A0AAD7TX23_9APHY|nr:hypothetical protein C8Q70DRAFT_195486 [Cubamyces menziesii]KAJ8487581.1 hypothetical protein ONZ51_g4091 [Trametes cubensis]
MLVNRTIDDEYGDLYTGLLPDYSPINDWTLGTACHGCGIGATDSPTAQSKIIDVTRVYNGTWHDTTYHFGESERNVTVSFTGRAVYVFNLIVNTVPSVSTFTALDFCLDGSFVGTYAHWPNNSTEVEYDVPVYVNTTLVDGPHTLVISTAASIVSLILFDYIIYTIEEDEKPTTQSDSPDVTQTNANGPSTGVLSFEVSTPTELTSHTSTPNTTLAITSNSSHSVASVPTQTSSRDGASASSTHTALGPIVGSVVGGFVALLLLMLVFRHFKLCRRVPPTALAASKEPLDTSSASDQISQHSVQPEAATTDMPYLVATPPATADRPRSELSPIRPSISSRSLLRGIRRFNTAATLQSAVVALRDEVAMLRADGVGVQRRPDTLPPRYEPPRQAREALKLGA